ncbi:unnamed protein product [Paramecium sonneborni]|uniref:Uncharacterized protein n=1 Tax=Paramecium sonneborni TaxID=65129 RepID=A0A8S1QVV5_9CILI|nr:unnamed protein product [Paramecium sonneborni]
MKKLYNIKDNTKDSIVNKENPQIDNERLNIGTQVKQLKDRLEKDYNLAWDKQDDYEYLQQYRESFLKQIYCIKRDQEKKEEEKVKNQTLT